VRALFAAPVAVAIHRYILLGEKTSGIISLRPNYTRHFIGWLIGIQVLISGVLLLTGEPKGPTALLAFIAVVLALVGSVWIAMLFPAVAVNESTDGFSERIEMALERTSGNFWLVLRSLILTFLPLVVAFVVFTIWYIGHSIHGAHVPPSRAMEEGPFSIALAPLEILSIGLGAAVASWVFAWASHNVGPGLQSDPA
jgi:hypothetical protein